MSEQYPVMQYERAMHLAQETGEVVRFTANGYTGVTAQRFEALPDGTCCRIGEPLTWPEMRSIVAAKYVIRRTGILATVIYDTQRCVEVASGHDEHSAVLAGYAYLQAAAPVQVQMEAAVEADKRKLSTIEHSIRPARQRRVMRWCSDAFSAAHATSRPLRGLRHLEEATELAQAVGVKEHEAERVISHVFSRPAGEVRQEIGGSGLTLLALAAACDVDADEAERDEIGRVLAKPLAHFAARNAAKSEAGLHPTDEAGVTKPQLLELYERACFLLERAATDMRLAGITGGASEYGEIRDFLALEAARDTFGCRAAAIAARSREDGRA